MQRGTHIIRLRLDRSKINLPTVDLVRASRKLLLVSTALFCFTFPVLAQVPKPEQPTGPLLRAPSDFSKWEITFSFASKQPKKSKATRKTSGIPADLGPRPQKLVTTKTGRLIHEERTDVFGKMTDVWYEGGVQYTKPSIAASWLRSDNSPGSNMRVDPNYRPLPAIGYRDVDLVSAQNYAGTVIYGKRPCLVFVPEGSLTFDLSKVGDALKKLKGLNSVAFVDAETRLPVEVRSRGESRVFQFDPPPTRMQTLPAELIAQIRNGDEARTRLNQPAPRPY